MSLEWMDGIDHYGTGTTGRTNMLAGVWAELHSNTRPNATNPRTGANALRFDATVVNNMVIWRRVLSASRASAGIAFGYSIASLPTRNNEYQICRFMTAANTSQFSLALESTGVLTVYSEDSGAVLGQSVGPVVAANAYQYISIFAACDDTAGSVEVRVDNVTVISEININTDPRATGEFSQFAAKVTAQPDNPVGIVMDWDDFWTWNSLGTQCNDFPGNVRVRRKNPDQDTAATDWVRNTGSTDYSAINNDAPDGDTTYIEAANVGDISEFEFEDTSSDVSAVLAAQTVVMARKTDAGDCSIQISLVSAASESNGSDRPLTTIYTYWQDIHEVDPDTGSPWTKSAIDAAKFKMERTA